MAMTCVSGETSVVLDETGSSPGQVKCNVQVVGTGFAPLNLDGTVEWVLNMVQSRSRGYACIANAHTTAMAARDEELREALRGAAVVVADGMPVVWRVRAAGYPEAGRVYGADLVKALCAAGLRSGIRHGFFGGADGAGEGIVSHLKIKFPSLRIAGAWNPGTIHSGEASGPGMINAINQSGCHILWVGLGAPKQEIWMSQHRSRLSAPVLIGVGQAFDLLAGRTIEPPAWIGQHGLEWLYRLVHEPRRLWKRYLYYNSFFLWYIFRESISRQWHRS